MNANFEDEMNHLKSTDPAMTHASSRLNVPDFAKRSKTRIIRRVSVGLALFAIVAIPTVASLATRGVNESNIQFADGSLDGLKGAKKKPVQTSTQNAQTPIQTSPQSAQSVLFSGAPSLELGALPTELVGADQNFRTSRDGFPFPNYGGKPANDEIDATTMAALFGKAAVCADQNALLCAMLPGAKAVADQLNEALASGRCEGMAVLAQRFYDGLEGRPNGATSTAQIAQDQVAKQIGYWWATQVAPTVAANSKLYRAMPPTQITSELIKGLKDRSGFTLGLYSSAGGHSVTPIAVTKDGTNFNIYVYDNNYPNEIRKVVVNTTTESWSYGAAALNSSSAASTWTGSGAGSLDLTSMASRQGPFKVSLGSTKGVKGNSYSVIVTQQGNTTEPVGFRLTSRFGVVNSLDNKSVAGANFPIKSFLGAGVGQGAIAFIPTVFAEETGLKLQIVGGDKSGKYTVSVMRSGAAGAVVESKSKFNLTVSNSPFSTKFGVDLLSSTDKALVQLSSFNSGVDIQLTNGQSIDVSTTIVDDDAFKGSRRINSDSGFEVFSWEGKSLFSGNVETKLKKGQVQIAKLSVDSITGKVSQSVVEVAGVKVDEQFIAKIVPSKTKLNFDKPIKQPNAKLIEVLQPIQLPTRAIAIATPTTSVVESIQLPTRAIAGITATTTSIVSSSTTSLSVPPVTSPPVPPTILPAQDIVVTVRAQRFYGDLNSSIRSADWSVMSCVDSSGIRTGCLLFEESAKTALLSDLMQMNVNLDQMADVKSYSSATSGDLSAEMKPIVGLPANYTSQVVVELEVVRKPLTVNADAKSKVYGATDPELTFTTIGLVDGGTLTGALSRAIGEDVGSYAIGQGTLANSNYDITFTSDDLTITAKPITVTAAAVSKVYGAIDPALTYSTDGLVGSDELTGALSRTTGEDVNSYAINKGTLANSNYDITFTSDDLTITAKSITVTADAKSKVYRATDPELTFTTIGLESGDKLTGALDRAEGNSVGSYAIGRGTLANLNYDITFTSDDLSITTKSITVTAEAKSKVFGATDPELTFTTIGLELGDSLTGSLDRAAGTSVGSYAIGQGTLVNLNYDITFTSDDLSITTKSITVTADAASKVYGTTDPELTYTQVGLVGSDVLTGALDRAIGEDVNFYAIGQGTLVNSNYTITFTSNDLSITAKSVTVTADAVSKVYGATDPALTFTTIGLESGDTLTGALDRAIGEDVGSYAIGRGTLANLNYDITFTSDDLSITTKSITVTADAASKVYGAIDPALTYTTVGLESGDSLTGALDRAIGEDVGSYAIGQGTLANANYDITFTSDDLTITAKSITVTADAVSKVYGATDPALTYTTIGLESGDTLTGALDRAAGTSVGSYAIGQGTLVNLNYDITFTSDDLSITAKSITVTAEAKSKVYGATDTELTYTTDGLIDGDTLTGSLDRAAGSSVGSYAIGQGTLANANYDITFTSADLTITAKSVTVTADAVSKVYGATDPALTYTTDGLIDGDKLTGSLDRAAGTSVGSYAIGQGTLANSNYDITFTSADLTITTKSITVTADAASKVYGATDLELTYKTDGLIDGDKLTGSLDRAAGTSVGSYAIGQGTLANLNYDITFVSANLMITAKSIAVTADAASKVYGATDPALTFTTIGLESGETLTGALDRAVGEDVGSYAIGQGTLANSNYDITFTSDDLSITTKSITVTADAASKVYGATDPALTYSTVGLVGSDVLTGVLDRAAGTSVGSYAIGQGTLVNLNYDITFTSDDLSITAKSITVTAAAVSKVYGAADPALTYSTVGLVGLDELTGSLNRALGTSVGGYAIGQGTLANSNYTITTFTSADLTITAKPVTVTAAAKSKVYGAADPALTYSTVGLVGLDVLTGVLDRALGTSVGGYAIGQGTLANSNYDITFVSANLTITAKPVTVTAAAVSKVYGASDPELKFETIGLESGETLTGALDRAAGTSVGSYAIGRGTLAAGGNYTFNFVSADLTITAKPVTVTAAAVSKVYGATDPALTYSTVGLVGSDELTGSLNRALGTSVGGYAIGQGTLANSNYTITTFTSADLTITAKPVTVTAAAKSKVYGTTDPALTYSTVGLVGLDVLTGVLDRALGTSVGSYAIGRGTLAAGGNYTFNFVSADLTITAKPVTVTAAAVSKVYGTTDPALTYTTVGLESGDSLTGALDRAAGTSVGSYAIGRGTLAAGGNYTFNFVSANLTITTKSITVTAAAKSKVYGTTDPALTYSTVGLVGSDVLTGALDRALGTSVGSYAIGRGTLAAGGNYTFNFVSADLTITAKPVTVTAAAVSKVYGTTDPALTYTTVGLVGSDVLTGVLDRAPGTSVGSYAIGRGTLANANYDITFTSANLTITTKSITVTADAKSKVYGTTDPALTYTTVGLESGDSLTGALDRAAGTSVGSYAIGRGTLAAGGNYTFNFVSANLTITTKSITVTADAKSKVYGAADPALTYTTIGLELGDTLTGSLSRVSGENIGNYVISGTFVNSNYVVSFTSANLTISAAPITVIVTASSSIIEGFTTQASAVYVGTGATTWTAGPSTICSVSSSGLVAGLKKGNCTITANVSASGNYQAGSGSVTIVIEAVQANCGGGNGSDANTPGCTGGGSSETTTTTTVPVTTTTVPVTTTTVPVTTTTTTVPVTTTTVKKKG